MLKSCITDIESVNENLRPFYTEKDGRYVLAVEPVDGLALEDVGGLKAALAAERRAHADAMNALKEHEARYAGLDPDATREALERLADPMKDIEREVEARVERLRPQIAAAAATEAQAAKIELESIKTTLSKRDSQLQRLTRDAAIRSELDLVKPLEDAIDALMLMCGQHIALTEVAGELVPQVIDKKGSPRLDADGRPVSIRSFMNELRDSRPGLFQPTKTVVGLGSSAGRGTARPSGEPNPYAESTRNITQQVALEARDPARAARLRAEACVGQ